MVDVEPHTGEPVEPTGVRQAELAQRVDEQTLDAAHVRGRAEPVVDVQDRVADELTGAVVGDVAAALHRHEFGADRGRLALQVVFEVGPHPVGEHVRMLQQQQVLLRPVLEQRRLQGERLPVRHAAEPSDPERRGRWSQLCGPVLRLEDLLDPLEEAGRVGTVERPVVPAHGEVADRVDGDGLAAVGRRP